MSMVFRLRRGVTSVINQLVRPAGELAFDTQTKKLYVHDGSTVGGNVTGLTLAETQAIALAAAAGKVNTADLLSNGQIKSSYLPSYVDDVLEFSSVSTLPATGETGKIYVTLDTNNEYRWSGSQYIQLMASPGTTDAVPEGSTNKYFTVARVLATVLNGLSLASGVPIVATDSILVALGKLQAQITTLTTKVGSAPFSKEYVSADYTYTNGGNLVLQHGLGVVPKRIELYAVCLADDNGWSAGLVKDLNHQVQLAGTPTDSTGYGSACDNTTVFIRIGKAGLTSINYGTFQAFVLTPANWKLRVRAYA